MTTMSMEHMRILVTGADGLLGTAIKEILNANALKHPDNILYANRELCDLTDAQQVRRLFINFRPTHVLHLAGMVGGLFDNMERNLDFFEKNVLINMNVLGACARTASVVKVISCMSTCIFPDGADLPLTVQQLHSGLPHESNLGYSYAKRMIDVENRILNRQAGSRCLFTAVIPTNMFGPNDNYDLNTSHAIPALVGKFCDALASESPTVQINGTGQAVRQFLYSLDAARIVVHLLHYYDQEEPVILAPKEEYSISEVVDLIVEKTEYTGTILYTNKKKEDGQMRKTADGSRIFELIPDFAFTPFEKALDSTIGWYKENQNHH